MVAVCLIPGAAFHSPSSPSFDLKLLGCNPSCQAAEAKLETTSCPLTPNPAATYDPKRPVLCGAHPLTLPVLHPPRESTIAPWKCPHFSSSPPLRAPYLLLVSTLELAPALARPMALHGAQPLAQPSDPPRATFSTTPCLRIWQANIDLQHPVKHLFGA